ncbi:hemin-degrading factor [Pararhodobacter aggregans]|uniref:Hemin-degrading factor n=1 Tax=Pararhodobacter aggregans TaxID=404875 RepID=A0A2T7UUU6_9RHOB|nr:ChuX/HutX family heme-like substrate-binding protein [Pararhodobacter aggregans]PTX03987.1 putative hemin transport protein [Pararhodobacter aggregans]PVE48540.1 hemin-degrading factor [Pararhodobacter aggregans]
MSSLTAPDLTAEVSALDRSPQGLRDARAGNPKSRIRDLAEQLGVSEAHLVASGVDGTGVVRLTCDIDRLFPALGTLGPVMALTRNEHCVHEKDGAYLDYHPGPHAAMVLGPDIDLRIFPRHWVHAFALSDGDKRSIQIFDAAGDAVHKVHLRPASNVAAFEALVANLRAEDQSDGIETQPRSPVEAAKSNLEKRDILLKEWDALTDTHQFLRLTSKLKMNRLGAYRIAGAPYAVALKPEAVDAALRGAAEGQVPVMIFVGNMGCIQIHGGPVHRIEQMGPWLNVLDPGFNLHLRADKIAEVWLVRKPTKHGMAVSIEFFDADGMVIAQIFGQRAPGNERSEPAPEDNSGPLPGTEGWVALTDTLAQTHGI